MRNIDFEDEIIIKYHKFNFIPFQIFFCIYFVFCFYIEYFEYPNLFKRLLIVLLGIAFINVWFKEAYIIKFNKYGCKIKNLFFYKRYKWEEIVSIKYEYYCQYKDERGKYNSIPNLKSCIVFSCFKNIKPSWKEPYISTTIFKPFKFFYVNFPQEDYDSNNPCKYNYLTNEKLFLKKLEEWGVRIEGINDPPKPYENKKEKWF